MFQVDWLQVAINELAALWLQTDAAQRKAITAASHAVEQRLAHDPHNEGESRPGNRRITFEAPLAIRFQVEPDGQTVTILHVRLFRSRRT